MDPVTELTVTPHPSGLAVITLSWEHTGADRFMLGYDSGDGWTNLPPVAASEFGSSPYSILVPALPDTAWRVLAMDTDGTVSS